MAGVAAFAVIIAVCHAKGAQDIGMFAGLGRKKPLMAVVLTFAMLSMAGIPIFSGFWAKLFLFSQMVSIGEYLLVFVGVLNSIISVFFYFRVINMMFMQPSEDDKPIEYPAVIGYVATIAILLNILLGIFPSVITGLTL
ncbi:NADH-quinone oxidoreductase subunit N [bioreactor metagenome]|uniref:NADH-quinone oxidoreductase subunit N n=1 Tax=bioreactor metagenome TaxID=1076179 RepID=A0A645HFF9_9ZZZZ